MSNNIFGFHKVNIKLNDGCWILAALYWPIWQAHLVVTFYLGAIKIQRPWVKIFLGPSKADMVPVAIVQVRGSKPSLGVIGHWIVFLLNLQNFICVISEQKEYFNEFNLHMQVMLLINNKKFQHITKNTWFCIYFTQNESGKLIF